MVSQPTMHWNLNHHDMEKINDISDMELLEFLVGYNGQQQRANSEPQHASIRGITF